MTAATGMERVSDPNELGSFFRDNVAAHVYALVDLEEPFWSSSRWFRRGAAVVGLIRLPGKNQFTAYAVSTRDPAGSLELLGDLVATMPPGTLITGPVGLADTVEPIRPLAWVGSHMRYALRADANPPPPPPEVVALDRSRGQDLRGLYASDPGAAFFLPDMLDDDGYVGIYDGPELIAAAGTHVLSEEQRVAAIGAVFTRPEHRGRGHGRAVTLGVIERIRERVDTIALNVATANEPARAVYHRIGFEPVLTYDEAELA